MVKYEKKKRKTEQVLPTYKNYVTDVIKTGLITADIPLEDKIELSLQSFERLREQKRKWKSPKNQKQE